MTRRLSLLLVLLGVALPLHADEVPRKADPAIAAWRDARKAGNTARARAIASASHLDLASLGADMVAKQLEATKPRFHLGTVVDELVALRADAGHRRGLDGLDRLIARLRPADPEVIAREFRLASSAKQLAGLDPGNPEHRARVQRIRAFVEAQRVSGSYPSWQVYHRLGRGAGLAAYDKAAAYASSSGLHIAAARSYFAGGVMALRAKDHAGAMERGARSLEHAHIAGEPRAIHQGASLLAGAHQRQGNFEKAADIVAANMPTEAWQSRSQRHAYYVVAYKVQARANRPKAMLQTARHMHENASALGRTGAIVHALESLARAEEGIGQRAEAIAHYQEALRLDLSKHPQLAQAIRGGLAGIWNALGRFDEGEAAARKALTLSQQLGDRRNEALNLLRLAHALGGQKRWDESLAAARKSLSLSDTPRGAAEAKRHLAALLWRAGEEDRALAMLAEAASAYREQGDVSGEAFALWRTGVYRLLRNENEKALALADRSAGLLHPSHSFYERIVRLRAAAFYGLNRYEESAKAARESVQRRLRTLSGLAASDTWLPQRNLAAAAGYGIRSAWMLAKGDDAARWIAEAFEIMESSRALQLNAALRDNRAASLAVLPPALVRAEAASQEGVAKAHAGLVRESTKTPRSQTAIAHWQMALDRAWKERDRIIASIERVSRRAAVAAAAKPASLPDFRSLLRPGDAWIAWTEAGNRIMALCIRQDAARLFDLGERRLIEEKIEAWRRALAVPGSDDQDAAKHLYALLVHPMAPLLDGVDRLIASPSGALASIPLAALVTTKGRRLIERLEVLYAPSATSYAILASDVRSVRPSEGLLGVIGPAYEGTGLPELEHAADEARRVEQPFPASRRVRLAGREATLSALRARIGAQPQAWRALHVCAHAFADPQRPERNGAVLAKGEMLHVDLVRRMRIPADLVVLSCCDGARGTPTAGEGQRGLVRAFLVAGAHRVVASCWRVSDKHTPAFMGRLYEAWQGEGHALPAALRTAQLERIHAGGALAHPYYWASFVAWGLP